MSIKLKLSVPDVKYKVDVELIPEDKSHYQIKFGFCRPLIEEVKAMEGAKWHGFENPPRKIWTIKNSARNRFTLAWMSGQDVFARYDANYKNLILEHVGAYEHQIDATRFILTRRRCILAGEMGVGKTRAMLMAMLEAIVQSNATDWIWVGTKASIKAVKYELKKWKYTGKIVFHTYDQLKKVVETWPEGQKAPQGIVFDESSRIKNSEAQRSKAARAISEEMATDWSGEEYVVLMSGAPAPKDPTDWWHQCEVACPGFLRESNVFKLKSRLCLLKEGTSQSGGVFKELVTWLDNDQKCQVCGQLKNDPIHKTGCFDDSPTHPWMGTVNEVAKLYERMKGLVLVQFKRDVLKHLPEKRYEKIILKPSATTLRTAKTLVRTASSVIVGLTLLRELSDGFQYADEKDGEDKCGCCNGFGTVTEWFDAAEPDVPIFDRQENSDGTPLATRAVTCSVCKGTCVVPHYVQVVREVETPKDEALRDLLELHEDCGRLVCYAGYTGSVDRIVRIAHEEGWDTIRVDGRGWFMQEALSKQFITGVEPIPLFQDLKDSYPKVLFVAQGGSAGMGLTLTASPSIVYWSNTFNADDRIQSEDRIHRPGMDLNRGATIYDLVHLPSDQLVLDNLQKKRDLQAMTMGDIKNVVDTITEERVV